MSQELISISIIGAAMFGAGWFAHSSKSVWYPFVSISLGIGAGLLIIALGS